MKHATTHRAPGFKVTKTDDHTVFHSVPIFAECERGDLCFDAKWIAGAVAEAQQQERDGYLPPLHTRHHEPATDQTDAVKAVGVFRITDAGPVTFKGKRITAVFADLIVTDPGMADELGRMKYPYRSVEIFDPEGPPKINGLALLDHEAPYLELPMLFAGEVDDKRDQDALAHSRAEGMIPDTGVAGATSFSLNYSRKSGDPVLGSVQHGKRAVLLFKFPDEDNMTDDNKQSTDNPANFADDSEDKDEDGENMEGGEGGGLDVGSVVKAIESGDISVADMDAILAAIQAQGGEPAPEEEGVDEPAPAPAPGAEIMKGGTAAAKLFAHQQGKIDALEAKDRARDAADKRTTDVGVAMKRLDGKPLGSDLEQRLTKFHNTVGGNAEAFKEYVDTMARSVGELPSDNSGANFAGQPKMPKAAMAYQNHGGEAVDQAAHFSREYQSGIGRNMRASEEAYVRINMKRLGFDIEETATA